MFVHSILRRQRLIVTLILMSVGISACGYKAPVYYPTQEQRQELEAKEARIKARKELAKQRQRQERQNRERMKNLQQSQDALATPLNP